MQTKKEEIQKEILLSAKHEFLLHGYQSSSMRTIAQKSHTTLGNLYHYFKSKEDILDAVIGDIPSEIETVLMNHENPEYINDIDLVFVKDHIETYLPLLFPLDLLLSDGFLILMEGCAGTKYESFREKILVRFSNHIGVHLKNSNNLPFVKAIAQGYINTFLLIAKSKNNFEQRKADLLDYMLLVVYGFPI